jgi:hypothetical protein
MKTLFLLLIFAIGLSACATPGEPVKTPVPDSACEGKIRGHTPGKLTYRTKNKFEMSVKLRFEVGSNTELRLTLDPKQGSEDAVITITGVSGELPDDGGSTSTTWLNKSGKAADFDKGTIIFCVPEVPIRTTYKFDIEVGGIGKLDPRADVTF